MKPIVVDAKGLECPQPVILTKKAIAQEPGCEVVVSVDNDVAKENVVRMAKHEGCSVTVHEKEPGVYEIQITRQDAPETAGAVAPQCIKSEAEITYMFDSDFIGTNRELGKVLSNGFLNAIAALPDRKSSIVLISTGVKLAVEGSYVLETLSGLSNAGFTILICGTCLDFFKIRDKVKVGTVSNALEIMECMTNAGKVIKF